ncbi:hypothetical protein ATANTOWER_026129, partial [Ataeniobius toweri]|nr:hypothetical protein [Ataeniobius toweri]
IKDSLMQALASYVCYPQSLRAVERIPEEQRVAMMRNLLAPYEQRPWAQTNWILVRLWRVSTHTHTHTHACSVFIRVQQ